MAQPTRILDVVQRALLTEKLLRSSEERVKASHNSKRAPT